MSGNISGNLNAQQRQQLQKAQQWIKGAARNAHKTSSIKSAGIFAKAKANIALQQARAITRQTANTVARKKTLWDNATEAGQNWLSNQSGSDFTKYARKGLKAADSTANVNAYVKAAEAKGGNFLTKLDKLTSSKNSRIGRLFRKIEANDKALTRKIINTIDDNTTKILEKTAPKSITFKGKTYELKYGAKGYGAEKGITGDFLNHTNRNFGDIIEQKANVINKEYHLLDKFKKWGSNKYTSAMNYVKNTRLGKFASTSFNKMSTKLGALFKTTAKTTASKPGMFSKAFTAFKNTKFGAAITTNVGPKLGLACRVGARCATALQIGLAAYEIGDACVKGYKQGGVKGLIKEGGKQTVKSGCGLAGGIAGMKIGAAIGAIGGPVGMLVGGAIGAAVGYIAGTAVGGAICKGVGAAWKGCKAAGKWIGEKVTKAWDGIKSGAKKVWNALTSW